VQIALFGGTFDPPHSGHYQVAKELLQRQVIDAVWFVPVKNHPFAKKMTVAHQRLAMLKILLNELQKDLNLTNGTTLTGKSKVSIERYEIDHPSVSYSFDTLIALLQKYPQHTFSWVIGVDNLAKFNEWHDYQKILQKFPVYVYPRQGFLAQPILPGMIYLADFPEINVSASEVRTKLHNQQSIDDLVLPAIKEYMRQNRLYN
jgi:nicotinate-nucleotide adenylyltransferase